VMVSPSALPAADCSPNTRAKSAVTPIGCNRPI
jgi:hypothetical protein